MQAIGSNAQGQLGVGHGEDCAAWETCKVSTGAFGGRVVSVASGSTCTAVWAVGERHRVYVAGELGGWGASDVFVELPYDALCAAAGAESFEVRHLAAAWDCLYLVLEKKETDVLLALGTSNAFGQLGVARPQGWVHRVEVCAAEPLWASAGMPDVRAFRVTALAAGVRHALAVLQGSHTVLLGWGDARHGQLGPPPEPVAVHGMRRRIRAPAVLYTWPAPTAVRIAAGMQHSVLATDTELWMFGSARHGQTDAGRCVPPGAAPRPLPAPDGVEKVRVSAPAYPACNWHTSLVLWPTLGHLGACGASQHDQIPPTPSVPRGARLRSGSEHSVLLAPPTVLGWGWNEHGNLGAGPESLPPRPLLDAAEAWAGYGNTYACSSKEGLS